MICLKAILKKMAFFVFTRCSIRILIASSTSKPALNTSGYGLPSGDDNFILYVLE